MRVFRPVLDDSTRDSGVWDEDLAQFFSCGLARFDLAPYWYASRAPGGRVGRTLMAVLGVPATGLFGDGYPTMKALRLGAVPPLRPPLAEE